MARKSLTNSPLYRDDLAHIHVDGYGFHWTGAADAILDWFDEFGISSGKVVDLGCGGGQWLNRLAREGYARIEEGFRKNRLTRHIVTFRRMKVPDNLHVRVCRGRRGRVAIIACMGVMACQSPKCG